MKQTVYVRWAKRDKKVDNLQRKVQEPISVSTKTRPVTSYLLSNFYNMMVCPKVSRLS